MKILITLALVALPAAAQACGMSGAYGHGGCSSFAPFLICALIAALGYWVAQHAAKETANCIKRMGSWTGTILVIIGLLGILCAAGSHIKRNMSCHSKCQEQGMTMNDSDENEKSEMTVKVEAVKTTAPAKKAAK